MYAVQFRARNYSYLWTVFMFWDITQSSLLKSLRRFGKAYGLFLMSALRWLLLGLLLILKVKATFSPKCLLTFNGLNIIILYYIYILYIFITSAVRSANNCFYFKFNLALDNIKNPRTECNADSRTKSTNRFLQISSVCKQEMLQSLHVLQSKESHLFN
jgi:membrane glycosyltransferase